MSTFPFLQLREFGDDGKLLGGGRIWFYEQGTTTPKVTWQDVAQTIPNANPVMLSASGSAKIECNGAYSYRLERYTSGGYILQDEGSFTSGDGNGSSSVTVYENYNALEVATTGDAVAIVQDGYNPGDRAGGVFLRGDAIPQMLTDGVSVIGVHKYRRVYNGPIAATWCGVVDTGLAQSVAVTRALNASITYGHPVAFDENIQLESNIQVQAGAAVILGDQCRLSGSIVVNWSFVQGSQLVSCAPAAFGPNVRPRFDTGVFDLLRLSWCKGATDDETLTQFLGMPNVDSYTLCVDKILDDVRTDFTPPGKTSVRFEGGRIRFTTGSRSIAISAWETPPTRQVFEFTSISVIGSIVLPEPARPEWFGAVGDGVADDTTPVSAAFKAGAVQCRGRYTHNAPGQNYGSTAIFGDNPIQALGVAADWSTSITIQFAVAFANLQLRDVAILAPASQSAIAVSGTLNALRAGFGNATAATIATTARFYAVDSVLQARGQVVTSGDISLSNIIYSGASLVNRETEAPVVSVRNLRIPTVPNAFFLATDADGDVFAKDSNVNLGVATADDFRTLELGAWKLIPGIVELTGTTPTLGTGVNGFSWNLVDNLAAAKTCIIPSGATTESNYFKVIGKGGSYEIVLNTSSPDTFAEGGTTLTINPPSKGVTSVELYRFGNVWYPIFGVL